jgi:hypothetical protein
VKVALHSHHHSFIPSQQRSRNHALTGQHLNTYDQSHFFGKYKLADVASQYRPEIFKIRIEAGVWRTSGDDHVAFYENILQNISAGAYVCATCLVYTDAVHFRVTSSRINLMKPNFTCFPFEPYQNFCYLRNYEGTNFMLVQFTNVSSLQSGRDWACLLKEQKLCVKWRIITVIHFSMECRRRRIWNWKSKPMLNSTPTSTYITTKDYHVIEDN